MKMLVSWIGTKTKLYKTIYILKDYIDSYSDINKNLEIGLYFFSKCPRNHRVQAILSILSR